jgi:predicted nucleic acid-binding protein
MTARCFVDSNVWLYFFLKDDSRKKDLANEFINVRAGQGLLFVSWQVLNEVWGNLLKKGRSDAVAYGMVEYMLRSCMVVDFSFEMLKRAHELRQGHSVSFWDSLVVAAALEAKCDFLVSEDMQDGKWFGTLRVRNLFV